MCTDCPHGWPVSKILTICQRPKPENWWDFPCISSKDWPNFVGWFQASHAEQRLANAKKSCLKNKALGARCIFWISVLLIMFIWQAKHTSEQILFKLYRRFRDRPKPYLNSSAQRYVPSVINAFIPLHFRNPVQTSRSGRRMSPARASWGREDSKGAGSGAGSITCHRVSAQKGSSLHDRFEKTCQERSEPSCSPLRFHDARVRVWNELHPWTAAKPAFLWKLASAQRGSQNLGAWQCCWNAYSAAWRWLECLPGSNLPQATDRALHFCQNRKRVIWIQHFPTCYWFPDSTLESA